MMRRLSILSALSLMVGCTAPPLVEPATINLEDALRQTVDAMVATQAYSRGRHTRFNMRTCQVTAELHLTAVRTVTDSAGVQVGAAAGPATLAVSASHADTQQGSRGSVVTMTLESDDCVEWRHKARQRGTLTDAGTTIRSIRP